LLIRAHGSPGPLVPVGPPAEWRRAGCRRTADPEALGSPAGYSVPPGRRLLWPHPRLWLSPGRFFGYRPGLCLSANGQSVPNLLRLSFFPCRLPCPAGPAVFDCSQSADAGLRRVSNGSASRNGPRKSRFTRGVCLELQSSLYATARKVARPAPTRAFTFELSCHSSPPGTSNMTTRANSQFPATGLAPAGQAALWAARAQFY
jgi:hypothetical protein